MRCRGEAAPACTARSPGSTLREPGRARHVDMRPLLALVLVVLIAAVAGAVPVTAPQGTVEVFSRGELVDILALFQVAGIEVQFAAAAGSYSAVSADHQVQFTPGGTLSVVDGRLLALPGPVRTLDKHTVASVASAALLLAPFGWTLTGSPAGLVLNRGTVGDRLEVSVVHDEDGATIVIAGSVKRPRVVAAAGAVTLQYPGPIVLARPWVPGSEVTSAEIQDASLVLRLATNLEVASSYPLEDPPRFVIKLGKPQAQGKVAIARGSATVVLDPGHGGEDQGAKGPGGELEKDLTLQIARATAARLQSAGVTVRLTRDGDEAVALQHRTALANRLQAVVFVSIHANASVAKGAKGAETYYMNADASDQQAAASAARENATASEDTVQLILWDLAHVANLNASARLARSLQERLNALQGIRDRGIRQAPFVVLTGATMPAALVEVGFLSNPDEAGRLLTAEYQTELATALADAVIEFLKTPEPSASPAPQP